MLNEGVQSAISRIVAAFGKRNAAFVSSGMAAVETALHLLGIRRGDSVLVPVECCYTVAAGVLRSGAQPIFFDTGKKLVATARDLDSTEGVSARALIAVHTFGLPCHVAAIRTRLPPEVAIIEDASLAFGVIQPGSALGAHSDVVIASLSEHKPIDLREGGVVFADEDLSRLLDRRSPESRVRDILPLPFPLSPLAFRELPEALRHAEIRLAARRETALNIIPRLQSLGFEVIEYAPGSVPGWHRIPVWASPALRRIALDANTASSLPVAQLPHTIDVPDLRMFRNHNTRLGCDRRDKERLLMIRAEPTLAVDRWCTLLEALIKNPLPS